MGIVTANGQWEHCNHCGKLVRIEELEYRFKGECKAEFHEYGCNICEGCNRHHCEPAFMAEE